MKIQAITGTLIETNNYIIGNDDMVVLIEASASLADIKAVVGNRKVKGVLLTHGHWDHYINLDKILEEFGTRVYMMSEAYNKIYSNEKAFSCDRNPKVNIDLSQVEFLDSKSLIDFGFIKFKVLKSPGHTNCSACFIAKINEEEIIFTGDTLFKDAFGRCDLPSGNLEEMKTSLKMLFEFSPRDKIYPGHGFISTIGDEKVKYNL